MSEPEDMKSVGTVGRLALILSAAGGSLFILLSCAVVVALALGWWG